MESLLKNRIIKTINLSFLAITSFVLYGVAVVIDLKQCDKTIKKSYCNLITPISRPSHFFYRGVRDAYKLVNNGTTSGMIAEKYVEDLNERFKDLRPGFNFIHQKINNIK